MGKWVGGGIIYLFFILFSYFSHKLIFHLPSLISFHFIYDPELVLCQHGYCFETD